MTDDHDKIIQVMQDITYIKGEISEIKSLIKEHTLEESRRYEEIMEKKADKWVEKAIIFAIVGIVSAAASLVWIAVTRPIL